MRLWKRDVALFFERYRTQWAVADVSNADALRFHEDLDRANRRDLLSDENRALDHLEHSLDRIDAAFATAGPDVQVAASVEPHARELRTALRALLRVKVEFIEIANAAIQRRGRDRQRWMAIAGLLGLLGSLALGLQVHRAIAPRIRRLVTEVQRFKELGVHQRVLEEGRDEIAILANALDAGFDAIASRDHERERFLAIVAHELKTPMTSILGFTELALAHPDNAQVRARWTWSARTPAAWDGSSTIFCSPPAPVRARCHSVRSRSTPPP
jgi:signal transduction histidine kinase